MSSSLSSPEFSSQEEERSSIEAAALQYAAHDLKNLLAAIRGNIELASRMQCDEKARMFLRNAISASDHANELMLALPHIHEQVRREEEVELSGLIRVICGYALVPRGVEWDLNLPEAPWIVRAVRKDLARALTNLFVNACEATESNQEEPPIIRIQGENVDEQLDEESESHPFACITVTDNGVGISETRMNRLFKGETSKGRLGSGLGLLSTLNIAAEHGGFMEITSSLGSGTSFKLFLPKQVQE